MPVDVAAILNKQLGTVTIGAVLSALITLIICLIVIRILRRIIQRILSKSTLEERVRKYILAAVKCVLYVITAIIVVSRLGIDMTSLIALLSVASLGVTLAVEDILANVAGGLVILSAKPFSIGDVIEASGTAGVVQEISLNYTKLKTADGHLVMLPNKALADSKMVNYTALGQRRVTRKVTASYASPTDDVKAACRAAIDMTENILPDPAPEVYLTEYGSSSIEYTVYVWTLPENYVSVNLALGEALRKAFADVGVEMTYDHLNVHIVDGNG